MRALAVAAVVVLAALGVAGLMRSLSGDARVTAPPADSASPDAGVRVDPGTGGAPTGRAPARAPVAARPAPRPVGDGVAPDEVERLNLRGIAALDAGDDAEAARVFERCVEARPDEPTYGFNLSEALARLALEEYGDGARESALARLERAHELAPDRDDVAELLAEWREESRADAELWQYETDHFELAFDAERDDLLYGAQDVLDVLEAAYHEYALEFGVDPVAEGRARVRVTITSRPDFERATGLGEWAGGAFDGTVRMPLSDLAAERGQWEGVLRHELVHVFVREVGGRDVPGWLNEGLAQWLEGPEGSRAALLSSARARLDGRTLLSRERLTGSMIRWEDADAVARAYAQAVLLVDALARTYGAGVLFAMVAGCDEGRDPARVFEEHTLVSLDAVFADLERDLAR